MCASSARRAWLAGAVAGTLALGAAACGDTDDGATDVAGPAKTTTAAEDRVDAPHEDGRRDGGGKSAADSPPTANKLGDGDGGSDPATRSDGATRSDRGSVSTPADTVRRMYRALARGDGKAFCATQAGVGAVARCDDDGGMSKTVAASPVADVLRRARIVGVNVDGRRAKVRVRVGGQTREVQLVRRGRRGWGVVESADVRPDLEPADALRAAPSP